MTFMIKIAQFTTDNKIKSDIFRYNLIRICQKIRFYQFQNILKIFNEIIWVLFNEAFFKLVKLYDHFQLNFNTINNPNPLKQNDITKVLQSNRLFPQEPVSKFKLNIGIKSCYDQLSFDQKLLKNSTNNRKMGYILKPSEPITS